jgi:hypothetical protein
MPMNIFKSKKPAPSRRNTIKKPAQADGRQTRRDFHSDSHDTEDECIDFLTVNEWLKERCDTDNAVTQTGPQVRFGTLVDGTMSPPESDSVEFGTTPSTPQVVSDLESNTSDPSTTRNEEPETARRPKADLIVGRQDPSSQYFTSRYLRISANSAPHRSQSPSSTDDELVPHPDLDPQAFELYQIWLHTGKIPLRCLAVCGSSPATNEKYIWQRCWPLFNAHIVGCTLNESEFADRIIDILEEKISPGVCADQDTIKHIFSRSGAGVSRKLKIFVVHRCIEAGTAGGFNDLDLAQLPPSFVYYTLQTAVIRLSHEASHSNSGCDYHLHETQESCYKMYFDPLTLRRERRMQLDREMTSRDSEEVLTNARLNGVKVVDWEQRRAEANRAMRQQSRRDWVGFKRMDGLSLLTQDAPKTTEAVGTSQAEKSSPIAFGDLRSPTANIFGTAQTAGAIDEVITLPTTQQPSLPPASSEVENFAAHPLQDPEALPEYRARVAEPNVEGGKLSATMDSSASTSAATHSMPSTRSEADPDLDSLYSAGDYETQSRFPGAFPESRAGSVRTPTPV